VKESAWQKVEELFAAALELPAGERRLFLARRCGDDLDLRAELTSLLDAHETSSGALDRPAFRLPLAPDPHLFMAPGTRLGSWKLGELLGSGGAGDVYRATRSDGSFEQQAAIKVLRREAAGQIERFNAERQILARLEHPGIARLLDGGVTFDGSPYAVVEYVDGQPLVSYCCDRALDIAGRLSIFAQVCDVVAYAHRNLIVHRDLKSANILVTDNGQVKLLDFGIAKQLGTRGWPDDRTSAPFTADYAAPEQLNGEPVTTATDVYSLGVLLFELLAGRRPWASAGMPFSRVVQLVVHEQPPLASVVAAKQPAPGSAATIAPRLLVGDLDAIIAKCLRKEPSQRYRGVDELLQDLERHQRHAPVKARDRQRWYVAGRWLRRNRWPVAGAAVVVASLATGMAVALWQAGQAHEQARIARAEADKSAFVRDFLMDIFNTNSIRQADPLKAQNTTALVLLDRAAHRLESVRSLDPGTSDELLRTVGALYADLRVVDATVRLSKRRLDLARESFQPDDPRVLDALVEYGTALFDSEEWKSAIEPLLQADAALAHRKDDSSRNRARVDLALSDYWRASDIGKSLFHATRAVDIYRTRAAQDPDYITALLAAGAGQNDLFHPKAAEQLYALAVLTQQQLGFAEAQQVQSIVLLADVQRGLLKNAEAERNYLRAIDMSIRTNGPRHIDTLQARMRYGSFLRGIARYREAIALLRLTEAEAVAALGEHETFHLPTIRLELGLALMRWGDVRSALPVLRIALAMRERTRPNTTQHANLLAALGAAIMLRGDHRQAEDLMRRAHEIFTRVGTKESRTVVPIYRIQNLLAWGHVSEALAQIDATQRMVAADLVRDAESWNDPLRAQQLLLLSARAQMANGARQTAESLLSVDAAHPRSTDEAASFVLVDIERDLLLGELYAHTGRAAMALPLLRKALSWRKSNLFRDSPLVHEAASALAQAQARSRVAGLPTDG
jgi:eukaryotic-like serine/threonine-protein kinase